MTDLSHEDLVAALEAAQAKAEAAQKRLPPWAVVLMLLMGGGGGGLLATGEKICRAVYGEEITESVSSESDRPARRPIRKGQRAKVQQKK